MLSLASKTTNAETLKAELEQWLKDVTEQNDKFLRHARDNIDACPAADEKSHSSVGTLNEFRKDLRYQPNRKHQVRHRKNSF